MFSTVKKYCLKKHYQFCSGGVRAPEQCYLLFLLLSFGVELGFKIFLSTFFTVKKKYKLDVHFEGGVRVPHILSTFFTVKKKYELRV